MSYEKQTWKDDDPSTPLSAERLNHIEDGVAEASEKVVGTVSVVESRNGSGLYKIEGAKNE